MNIIERRHGETLEHRHENYDYWHPVNRVHAYSPASELTAGHILVNTVPYSEEVEVPRGLQVQPFDWASWDDGCEAKGICQGYTSTPIPDGCNAQMESEERWTPFSILEGDIYQCGYITNELHHRKVSMDLAGLVEPYWQCPHCRQLQKPIQWIQGARLVTYNVEVRGNRTVIWAKVGSGAWFVLVIRAYGTLQGVASGICDGTVYFCGIPDVSEAPPQQLPDECATILARRMWYRLTKGYWSDRKKEGDKF